MPARGATKPTSEGIARFAVRLEPEPEGRGTFVVVPDEAAEAIGARGRTSVRGTIDGHPFLNQFMPYHDDSPRGWRWYMVVNKAVRGQLQKSAGDEVAFELVWDDEPRHPKA